MRKNLDSHYVDSLLQRDWRINPREYQSMHHSINEKDVVKAKTTDFGSHIYHEIYCNLSGGTNNFYDYILKHYGPIWERGEDVQLRIVVLSLPKEPYFTIEITSPEGDDIIGDYGYGYALDFKEGPFVICWGDSSSFEIYPSMNMDYNLNVVNFNGVWIMNPGINKF
ncbi:MAG: hypothetical protein J6R32_10935 [Bacteroidales bacterium]|nr:hypothetical protein [Bacteroidales bacterium]